MSKLRVFVGASVIAGAASVLTLSAPQRAEAFTCPCAPACQICLMCTDAALSAGRSLLGAARSSLNALTQSLSMIQDRLDDAIDLGFETQETAMDLVTQQTVAAHQAHAQTVSMEMTANREVELRLHEGLKDSMEALAQSRMIANETYRIANDYGPENVSRTSRDVAGMQAVTLSRHSRVDGAETEEPRDPIAVTSDFMVQTVQNRASEFLREILREQETPEDAFQLIATFMSNIEAGFADRVIREDMWDEAIAIRRAMAVPPGVYRGLRDQDLFGHDPAGYRRVSARARTAAEFLAWEMALRSEIETEAGATSLLNFIRSNVEQAYSTAESLTADVNSGERTLLNTIAAQEAMGNLIDMLILEAESYGNTIEAAKIGVYNDEVFNPHYGYNQVRQ
ncbi:hypothetical protein [Marinimicrobium sp. ABcell2]|uniref:hypothetical protein n=1 Tax=Marinimicrobium sp. ABcell2 TaxID=3069751 RepID=UPI0027B51C95|nr:hypothetical protein [Marinimicrobium sp. ABcell2]MDQ2077528.1 hypothetical protein [Marinimicrobium sp. ABcell2]